MPPHTTTVRIRKRQCSVAEDVENRSPPALLVEVWAGLAVLHFQIERRITKWLGSSNPKKMYLRDIYAGAGYLSINVYGNII
jgi:hypothetical protein